MKLCLRLPARLTTKHQLRVDMKTAREFISLYRIYRQHHPMRYALKRAYTIAVLGWSF